MDNAQHDTTTIMLHCRKGDEGDEHHFNIISRLYKLKCYSEMLGKYTIYVLVLKAHHSLGQNVMLPGM